MRDKHIHIAQDSELLKTIYRQVEEQLIVNKAKFTLKIWAKFIFYFTFTAFCYSALFAINSSIGFVLCFVLYGFISLLFAFNFRCIYSAWESFVSSVYGLESHSGLIYCYDFAWAKFTFSRAFCYQGVSISFPRK